MLINQKVKITTRDLQQFQYLFFKLYFYQNILRMYMISDAIYNAKLKIDSFKNRVGR